MKLPVATIMIVSNAAILAACDQHPAPQARPVAAQLTVGVDSHREVQVTLNVNDAAFGMGHAVEEFLAEFTRTGAARQVTAVKFIGNESLVDKYGRESAAPTVSYRITSSDALKIDFEHVTTFDVMNLAQDVTIMHPAAASDIEAFCAGEKAKYTQGFCDAALRPVPADQTSMSSTVLR